MSPGRARSLPPIAEFFGTGEALIEPSRTLRHKPRIPSRCVLSFFGEVHRKLESAKVLRRLTSLGTEMGPHPVFVLESGGEPLAVTHPGLGAPYSAGVLEELIGLGGRKFIACGSCGVLDPAIACGQMIVPTAALRDEGTSYSYQPRGRVSRPHRSAVAAIRRACRTRGIEPLQGSTWTTDAVYRETKRKIRARRDEGCLCVEMEAAALFAVASFRKVVFGQILYAGDDVSGERWDHRGFNRKLDTRESLFWLAVEACRRL